MRILSLYHSKTIHTIDCTQLLAVSRTIDSSNRPIHINLCLSSGLKYVAAFRPDQESAAVQLHDTATVLMSHDFDCGLVLHLSEGSMMYSDPLGF